MAVIQRVGSPAKPRKWMSVHEMGDMLGLKKTDRYWLVHKNYFRTETLLGKLRVEIASFEKWYANQEKYHKVTGEEPGLELKKSSYSPRKIVRKMQLQRQPVSVCRKWPGCLTFQEVPYMES